MGDRIGRGRRACHLNFGGCREKRIGDALNLWRHGRAKKQGLPGEGGEFEDPFNIWNESHIKHSIRLIHHHDLHAGQKQFAAFNVIEQPTGRCNQYVDTSVNQLVLLFEAHTANQQSLGQFAVFCVGIEVFGHLCGQFACGAKHQAARHPRTGATAAEQSDHGKGETGGLACSGLCDA